MKKNTREKGITLIALVVSVIVLLILAGVTLSLSTKNGLVQKTEIIANKHEESELEEKVKMAYSEFKIAKTTNIEFTFKEAIDNEDIVYKNFDEDDEKYYITVLLKSGIEKLIEISKERTN